MLGPLIMCIFIIAAPVILFFWNYQRTANKTLAYFLDETDTLKPELCVNYGDDWLLSKDGAYRTDTAMVRQERYPTGWPKALQQVVPAFLYKRGEMEPLNWKTVKIDPKNHVSAREVGALLEPEWLRALVKGIKEGASGGLTKQERIVLFIGAGAGVFALIMIFVLMTRK